MYKLNACLPVIVNAQEEKRLDNEQPEKKKKSANIHDVQSGIKDKSCTRHRRIVECGASKIQ